MSKAWEKGRLLREPYMQTAEQLMGSTDQLISLLDRTVVRRDENLPIEPAKLRSYLEEHSLEIRRTISCVDTVLDLLFYFSDVPEAVPGYNHHKRVRMFHDLLLKRREAYEVFAAKLGRLALEEPYRKAQFTLLLPILCNVSLQSFSIFSELRSLVPLLKSTLSGESGPTSERFRICLAFLTNPVLDRYEKLISQDKSLVPFFAEYMDGRTMEPGLVVNANALRIQTVVVQYLLAIMLANETGDNLEDPAKTVSTEAERIARLVSVRFESCRRSRGLFKGAVIPSSGHDPRTSLQPSALAPAELKVLRDYIRFSDLVSRPGST